MNIIPSSSARDVPSIQVHDSDADASYTVPPSLAGFELCDIPTGDNFYGLHPEYSDLSQLEDMLEFSHLSQPFITGPGCTLPYPGTGILQDNATAATEPGRLSSSSLSPAPSPTPSFSNSLSPSSSYDPFSFSDSDSPISPSPATPDTGFFWPPDLQGLTSQSSDSLVLRPSFMGLDDPFSLGSTAHRRTKSTSSARREPVASKAMLEANSRRRRHPAQFECSECQQTFTALFSLKRHMQSHTGERPFACGISGCTQRFFNSSDCKRHERSKKRHKDLAMQ